MSLKNYLESKYGKRNVSGYENMIRRYTLEMGEEAEVATYTLVLEYLSSLRKKGLHPKSLRNHLSAIKIYYRYLQAIGKRKDHPCSQLKLQDQIDRSIAIENLYTKKQLEELYKNYKSSDPKNQLRDQVIISLLIYQALTVLEITQLKIADINLEAGTIKVKGNKKNKGRTLHLKPSQIMLFHSYQKTTRKQYQKKGEKPVEYFILNIAGNQMWSGGINRLINRGKRKYERMQPLKIRQSVISHLLKEKNDVRIVQEFAGHRCASSTEAYQQTGLEELKMAIDQKHPLQ